MKELPDFAITVFINTKANEWSKMPAAAQSLSRKPEAGRIIPMVFVTNPDGTEELGLISYSTIKQEGVKKSIKALQKTFPAEYQEVGAVTMSRAEKAAALAKQAQAGFSGANQVTTFPTGLESWKDARGRSMRAKAVGVNDQNEVMFKSATGREMLIPMDKLSDASRERIEMLATAKAE